MIPEVRPYIKIISIHKKDKTLKPLEKFLEENTFMVLEQRIISYMVFLKFQLIKNCINAPTNAKSPSNQ